MYNLNPKRYALDTHDLCNVFDQIRKSHRNPNTMYPRNHFL